MAHSARGVESHSAGGHPKLNRLAAFAACCHTRRWWWPYYLLVTLYVVYTYVIARAPTPQALGEIKKRLLSILLGHPLAQRIKHDARSGKRTHLVHAYAALRKCYRIFKLHTASQSSDRLATKA